MNKVIHGNCIDVLKTFESNSIDSIVTDPPYFLVPNGTIFAGGFMNKEWDGIVNLWRYVWNSELFVSSVVNLLQSTQIGLNMEEVNTVQKSANINQTRSQSSDNVHFATQSLPLIHPQLKDSVRLIAVTKQEVLDWLKESSINLTKTLEKYLNGEKENALFVIPILLPTQEHKNIVVKNVIKLLKVGECQESKITFTQTEAQKIRNVIVAMGGILSGSRYIDETDGSANIVESIVEEKKYNATILYPTLSEELMMNITLLLFVTFVTHSWNTIPERLTQNFFQTIFTECLRVLKPGGHLLSFSGTRTYHRMACAIEDAGFEIRDMIEWVYGSGFPKSLNVGKKVDEIEGNEREVIGKRMVVDITGDAYGSNNEKANDGRERLAEYIETKGQSEYEGFGSALKPAHESICMARKPLEKSLNIAENVLKHGTGALNIDESRIGFVSEEDIELTNKKAGCGIAFKDTNSNKTQCDRGNQVRSGANTQGRFPANLILSDCEEVRACFPETKSGSHIKGKANGSHAAFGKDRSRINDYDIPASSGNASRFFKNISLKLVDYNVFSLYICSELKNIKEEICGQHLTKKKTGIMLDGVIQEAEKFIQDVELLIYGNSTMGKFLMDIASTIKTLTARMIELKTLNVLPNWLITKFTEESEKTINLLKELNIEDVKSAKSIFLLQTFIREVLENIKAIAKIVVEQDLNNGKKENDNSRFFKSIIYEPKASKSERGRGNNHPTVKPVKLIEYLINMVTPKGGTVLDMFGGSGTTALACLQVDRNYILIEQDEKYIEIINKRISRFTKQLKLFND